MSNLSSTKNIANTLKANKTHHENGVFSRWLKKAVKKQLQQLQHGTLELIENDTIQIFSGNQSNTITAEIEVLNDQFYWFIAFGGGVGAGEAYINQYWRTPDLTKVIQLFAINQSVMDAVESGLARLTNPMKKTFHWLNKNTQKGSKANIVAHYDLGNDFFKLFLDPTMMYSSGIFYHQNETMEQASINKIARICTRLKLSKHDNIVEIGTGWGSFAIYAAKHYGCHITTTTISEEQYQYTLKRIQQEGLEDKIRLLKKDYRQLNGKFDKLVSIEMIEAVGHHYFDAFFSQCSNLLKPDGEMLIQAITITDQRFEQAKNSVDFIKRYIFPGCCIPSLNAISHSVTQSSQLRITHMEDIGVHYAKTLNHWFINFKKNQHQVKQQGFSNAFIRMWEYYLCYCEGGFKEQVISTTQLHLVKPLARPSMALTSLEN